MEIAILLLVIFLGLGTLAAVIVIGLAILRKQPPITIEEVQFAVHSSWQQIGLREAVQTNVQAAVMGTWISLGMEEKMGTIATKADDMRKAHVSLERMLRIPHERGSFGEVTLETILSDKLPADYFGIRTACLEGSIPDAWIRTVDGLLCIDSKFPLENYLKFREHDGPANHELRNNFHKAFIRDTRLHLKKVADDYVRADQGTVRFAFVFIPSEAVYYFLAKDCFELLQEFVSKGVLVVSPLLLAHHLESIREGVRVAKLNENAQLVSKRLEALGRDFAALDSLWSKFMGQLRNAQSNAVKIEGLYGELAAKFARITAGDDPAGLTFDE